MDNEPQVAAEPGPTLPRTRPFATPLDIGGDGLPGEVRPAPGRDGREHAGVFGRLVKDDADITGLVAYSIYKQHKLDWLQAFETAKGRAPDEAELAAYIIGEGTARRLATYRHLAEATLGGNGLDVGGGRATPAAAAPRYAAAYVGGRNAPALVAVYGIIALLFVAGFWLALHFTMSTR